MNQFSGEWAARKHNREMDRLLNESAGGAALDKIADVGGALATVGAIVAPVAAPPLGIARATFVGLGLFRKAWKFGKPSIEQMIEDIEAGADSRFQEIEDRLRGQEAKQRDFETRMQSQEADNARLSALFHGLRSSDPEKHERLGALTVSCIFANDLRPETLDDTMRAAVELKDADLSLLGEIYLVEKPLIDRIACARRLNSQLPPNLHAEIQPIWKEFARSLDPANQLAYRSSLARLQSHGMIQQVSFSNFGLGHEPYLLLDEGVKFYERLQEIGKDSGSSEQ